MIRARSEGRASIDAVLARFWVSLLKSVQLNCTSKTQNTIKYTEVDILPLRSHLGLGAPLLRGKDSINFNYSNIGIGKNRTL